ncbi:hypothetical protein F4781DRAFT_258148 [Annulohypoxylon bovei var. microspora]|nr:hypothetical protein F4781DRAFT_258148 [Annulohypoxylon bovei var. microspora]
MRYKVVLSFLAKAVAFCCISHPPPRRKTPPSFPRFLFPALRLNTLNSVQLSAFLLSTRKGRSIFYTLPSHFLVFPSSHQVSHTHKRARC